LFLFEKARRTRDIDSVWKFPFTSPSPAGFHEVSTEDAQAEHIRGQRKKDVDYHKENENQYDTFHETERRLKLKTEKKHVSVVAQVSKTNGSLATRKRGVLGPPAPSVTNNELKKLTKLTAAQQDAQSLQGTCQHASLARRRLGSPPTHSYADSNDWDS
jgi:hypothetical protein